jgi:hypothetical protein
MKSNSSDSDASPDVNSRIITALLLIVVPLLFTVVFTLLEQHFEYPLILRKPAGYVLEAFHRGGTALLMLWYGMMFSALLFIPLAVGVGRHLKTGMLTVVFGIIAGLVQALGLARWVFLVPHLTTRYLDPTSSTSTRDAVLVLFDAFNQLLGVGIGEHLGYLFTGLWTLLVAQSLRRLRRPWLGGTGIVVSLGILSGMLEATGAHWASITTSISYLLWSIWMISVGAMLLRNRAITIFVA